jgi:hypothetical protein
VINTVDHPLGNIQSSFGNIQSSLGNFQSSLGNIQLASAVIDTVDHPSWFPSLLVWSLSGQFAKSASLIIQTNPVILSYNQVLTRSFTIRSNKTSIKHYGHGGENTILKGVWNSFGDIILVEKCIKIVLLLRG